MDIQEFIDIEKKNAETHSSTETVEERCLKNELYKLRSVFGV